MPRPASQLLDAIRADAEVRQLLGDSFDFYLTDDDDHDWLIIDGVTDRRAIAKDGGGGPYLLFGKDDRLAYVTSEGRAGIIAASLEDSLNLLVAYPYWLDLLDDNADAMHEGIEDLEESMLGDIEDLDEHRAIIRERLKLKSTGDELAKLHRAITTLGRDFLVRPPNDPQITFQAFLRCA